MNENDIRQIVQSEIQNYLPTFRNLAVPTHTHNGVDSLQILPENLAAYTPYNLGSSNNLNPVTDGTWRMFTRMPSSYDYGFQLYTNNKWNILDLANFQLSAQGQNTPQTINNGATATIIFDSFVTQEPSTYYDSTTGIWSLASNSWYLVDATVTFDAGGVPTGTFTLSVNDGTLTKSVTVQATDNKQSLHATFIMPGTLLSSPHVSVTNNSGAARTTTGAIDECVLTIKQLK